jgi:hypothetical protein
VLPFSTATWGVVMHPAGEPLEVDAGDCVWPAVIVGPSLARHAHGPAAEYCNIRCNVVPLPPDPPEQETGDID